MDYDALVKQFGKDQADLIVSQMNSDPRLQRFTPQRLSLMQDDANRGMFGTIKAPEMTIPRFIETGGSRGLERLGMDPRRANQYAGMLRSVSEFFTPIGDAMGFENASNLFDDAQRQVEGENYFRAATDYALGATEGVLAAIGSVGGPIGRGISRGGRRLLRSNLRNRPNTSSVMDQIATPNPRAVVGGNMPPSTIVRIGQKPRDPRILKSGAGANFTGDPRVSDMDRIANLEIDVSRSRLPDVPIRGLDQYEGRPFIISMSDRTAAGDDLLGVNNLTYDIPVSRRGGQDFMFDPVNEDPSQVWSSMEAVVRGGPSRMYELGQILKTKTGKDPLFVPWTMSPTGGDFAQTSQVMLTHARNAMEPSTIKQLNKEIREFMPEFKGVENPDSMTQIYTDMSGPQRFKMMDIMDKRYRDKGSLTTGEARLAMVDEAQLEAPDTALRNIGIVDTSAPVVDVSGHPVYSTGLSGRGDARLDRPIKAYELLPDYATTGRIAEGKKPIVDVANPTRPEMRPLEVKAYSGIVTDKVLKNLGY